MKKSYQAISLMAAMALLMPAGIDAQSGCAISGTTGLHGYGCGVGDQIEDFELNGTANPTYSCSNNSYEFYSTPVWNLTIGNTYTWSAVTGSLAGYQQGFAMWIDLNNDGFFTSNEQMGNSGPNLSHAGTFSVPFSASPGSNVRMRLRCDYYATIGNTNQTACEVYGSPNYNFYYGETEDYLVNLLSPTPCSGTPGANAVVTPTAPICPNSSALIGLQNTYTVGDITYQWQVATTSSVGPFTSVSGATMSAYTTPTLGATTWYQVIITCTNSSQQITATVGEINVSPTVTNTVPYFEGFEGISGTDKLPNCSWTASFLGSTARTYTAPAAPPAYGRWARTGNNFASFYYSPSGARAFYTNGIWMNAGVTYSATVWFQTEYYGYNNWSDLSILAGPSQTTTGQFTIATTNGPAVSSSYKALTNTFTVPTSGLYYVSIRATGNTNSFAQYLSWDDLSITIPCQLNTPTVTTTANTNSICAGQNVNLTATGADTYTWSTGATGSALVVTPQNDAVYTVTGTHGLSGCSATSSQSITVKPAPMIGIFVTKPVVCAGETTHLTAFGASTYTWSTNNQNPTIAQSPQSTTTYSVIGTNIYGCTGQMSQQVVVNPLPAVNAVSDRSLYCIGEKAVLTGSGANSYQWSSSMGLIGANPAIIYPNSSVSMTLTGTDANGCAGTTVLNLNVDECTGLSSFIAGNDIELYPNPNNGEFTIEGGGNSGLDITLTDMTGRVVAVKHSPAGSAQVDISDLASGIYYAKVKTAEKVEIIKVIKN
jgi:hypothetical protein